MLWFLVGSMGEAASLDSAPAVSGAIEKSARSLFYNINTQIYRCLSFLYQLFEGLCNARFLDETTFSTIATKAGMVLGVVMLFRVIFNFIQILLDPNKMDDKEAGAFAIVKKCLLVIVMLGVSNFFFESLYYVQKFVIHEKVIYKLLLPVDDVQINTDNFGQVLSARVFGTFYNTNEVLLAGNIDEAVDCVSYRNLLLNNISLSNEFTAGKYCLNAYANVTIQGDSVIDGTEIEEDDDDENTEEVTNIYETTYNAFIMDYNFLLQTLFGAAFVYLLFMYVIKVGIRVIQMTVLQIISPMAIISYLSPKKDNMFTKWWKIYFATYIDVFVRVGIIYFMIFLSSVLLDTMDSGSNEFWESVNPANTSSRHIIVIVMILALFTFAKKAPDLLKELLPASASKLGFGASMKDIVGLKVGTGAIGGALGGTAIGLLGGGIGGAAAGFLKGSLSGLKGQGFAKTAASAWSKQLKANKAYADARANGASWWGYQMAHLQQNLGMRTAADVDKQNVDDVNNYIKYQDEIEGYAKNYNVVKRLERDYEAIKQAGRLRGESDDHYTARMEAARQNWKRAMEATVTSSMTGRDADYHAAELSRNATTGRWEVVDSATTTTIAHGSVPINISGSISSKTIEMNRVGNSLGYSSVSNYTDMDNNNNQAKADVATMTSQRSYSRNRANAGK